jgi:pimeloyl-ACP methyl ester carboxylesterase
MTEQQPVTRWCTVDAVPIAFTDTGSGNPVVFVHGVYVTGALG